MTTLGQGHGHLWQAGSEAQVDTGGHRWTQVDKHQNPGETGAEEMDH